MKYCIITYCGYIYIVSCEKIAFFFMDWLQYVNYVYCIDKLAVVYTCFQQTSSDCVAPRCYCILNNNECYLRIFGIKLDMNKLTELHNQKTVNYDLVITVVNNAMLTATTFRAYKASADTEIHVNHVYCLNVFCIFWPTSNMTLF